jgi:hypothetical protein
MKRVRLTAGLSVILLVVLEIASGNYTSASDDAFQPLITTSELVVGPNRFAFGAAKQGKLIERADVLVRLYSIDAAGASLLAETNAPFRPLASLVPEKKAHIHADGTRHIHDSSSAVGGIYVAQLMFPRAGDWGLEIIMRHADQSSETARLTVIVREESTVPAIGRPAPRSRNLIASDVKDLRQIDTSERPDPRLHQMRIADAIAMGRPQLIVFATPQFCTSRMCGPVVDIVRTLLPIYGERVAFIHQEIWQDFATQKMFPTVEEWRLQSEPWIFVIDRRGIIRAKFEGLVTERELEAALQAVLIPRR